MPVFLDPPVDVTPGTLGVYTDVDVSAHMPSSATGVILRMKNSNNDTFDYGLRRKGASDGYYLGTGIFGAQNWEVVPVDANQVFQARLEMSSLSLELVGYFEEEAVWATEPVNKTPPSWSGYVDIDISGDTGAAAATAAFLLFEPIATAVFARAKGITEELEAAGANRQPCLSGVDGSEILQAYTGSSSQRLRLLGWMTKDIIVEPSPIDVTPGSNSTWTTHTLPAGATGAVFWAAVDGDAFNKFYGARRKGSGLAWNGGASTFAGLAIVGADGNGEVELYSTNVADLKLYRVAYFFDQDDHVITPRDLVGGGEVEAVEAEFGDTHIITPRSLTAAGEVDAAGLGSFGIEASPPVVALVALPFDSAIEIEQEGPPSPLGAVAFGGIAFSSFGAEAAVYASDAGYDSQAADTPASMPFAARLLETAGFETRAFEGDRPAGAARETLGALTLANGDRRYDDVALLGWDGRTVELWRGTQDRAFADFKLLLRGTARRVSYDEARFTIALRDRQAILDRPVNATLYGGAGGLDGHDGIVGLAKPCAWGPARNVPLVNIDPVNLVYQAHDGPMEAFEAVRDKGIELTFGADRAGYDALLANDPAAGSYDSCLAQGVIRLNPESGTPDGEVTADIRGDNAGGYVETTADIARRIVTTRLGGSNLSDSELDTLALDALAAAQPAPVGYWTGTGQVTAREVLDSLLGGIGGWHSFTRDGKFTAARLIVSGAALETVTPREIGARQPAQRVEVAPVWQVRVAWGRSWLVQSADALASTVSSDDKAFFGQALRYAPQQDSTIRGRHRLAVPLTVESYFAEESDAETEAARLLALYGPDRDIWTLALAGGRLGRRWLGDLVEIDLTGPAGARYGLPKTCAVIGLREDVARGEVTLTLWG